MFLYADVSLSEVPTVKMVTGLPPYLGMMCLGTQMMGLFHMYIALNTINIKYHSIIHVL